MRILDNVDKLIKDAYWLGYRDGFLLAVILAIIVVLLLREISKRI